MAALLAHTRAPVESSTFSTPSGPRTALWQPDWPRQALALAQYTFPFDSWSSRLPFGCSTSWKGPSRQMALDVAIDCTSTPAWVNTASSPDCDSSSCGRHSQTPATWAAQRRHRRPAPRCRWRSRRPAPLAVTNALPPACASQQQRAVVPRVGERRARGVREAPSREDVSFGLRTAAWWSARPGRSLAAASCRAPTGAGAHSAAPAATSPCMRHMHDVKGGVAAARCCLSAGQRPRHRT